VHARRLLEVGAARAADQHAVAGEGHALVVEHIGDAAARVPRRRAHLERALAEGHPLAVLQQPVGARRAARLGKRDAAAEPALEQPRARDVIGVDVGLERPQEFQPSSEIRAASRRPCSNTGSIITASPVTEQPRRYV